MRSESEKTMQGHRKRLRCFTRALFLVWTGIVSMLLYSHLSREYDEVLEVAAIQARSLLQRDLVYRQWAAMSSGIYVRAGRGIEPNPHLSWLADRDIVTSDGRKFTLVNPAYMSRLVYELAARRDGSRSHITSLKPVRPENAPDPWEAQALRSFGRGEKECRTVLQTGNREYLRLMTPLFLERECFDCHARQGYRVGEVRGGVSVNVPLEPLQAISRREKFDSTVRYGVLWLVGMSGIVAGTLSLRRSLASHEVAGKKLRYMSTHDSLTDCYNRIYFETEIERLAKGRDFPIGVVMADLDGLKEVNDRLGHNSGDALILQGARVLKQACRGRRGGPHRRRRICAPLAGDRLPRPWRCPLQNQEVPGRMHSGPGRPDAESIAGGGLRGEPGDAAGGPEAGGPVDAPGQAGEQVAGRFERAEEHARRKKGAQKNFMC